MAVAGAVLVLLASAAHAWMPDANAKIHVKYGMYNKIFLLNIMKYV